MPTRRIVTSGGRRRVRKGCFQWLPDLPWPDRGGLPPTAHERTAARLPDAAVGVYRGVLAMGAVEVVFHKWRWPLLWL